MKYLLSIILILTLAVPSFAAFTLNIQFKPDVCANQKYTPQETEYWTPCFVETAKVIQQLNVAFADQLIHGVLASNPDAKQVEGYLGTVNTPANEAGVVTVLFDNYNALKIPYLPPFYYGEEGEQLPLPFLIYLGDTSEKVPVVDEKGNPIIDEEGNPVTETISAGSIAGVD